MFTMSLVLSSVLFVLTAIAVWRAPILNRAYVGCWLGLIPVFCTIPVGFVSFLYFFHALALGVFASLCAGFHANKKVFLAGSLAVFAGVYLSMGLPRWLRIQKALENNPSESLVERLDYERKTYAALGREAPPLLGKNELWHVRYGMDGQSFEALERMSALQALHEHTSSLFENTPDFGVARMMRGSLRSISADEPIRSAPPLPAPQPASEGYEPPVTAGDTILTHEIEQPIPAGIAAKQLVESSLLDFLNPIGFGYVRDTRRVAGFSSHRFTRYPELILHRPAAQWRVESIDLVSMLKHAQPVAYVSKNLPRMDELRDAPTRPLDDFEREQLPKLKSGGELAAMEGPRRIRVLGAIRAHDACRACHAVNAKDLIGAFSYDLRLDRMANK